MSMAISMQKRKEGMQTENIPWLDRGSLSCWPFAWKMAEKTKDEAERAIRQAEYLQGHALFGDIAACGSRAAHDKPQCRWHNGKNMGGW